MHDAIEKEAEKVEKQSTSQKDNSNGTLRDELGIKKSEEEMTDKEKAILNEKAYELDEEQIEKLKEAESQKVEDAIDYNNSNLVKGTEVAINVPVEKTSFKDMNEASQYFSYVLFQYHTNLIDGPTFYKKLKAHMAKEFVELLPKKEADREDMFTALQELFTKQLEHKIESYAVTEVEYSSFTNEGAFNRKYVLYNGDELFYKTIITQEDGVWKIVDDSPGEGYTTKQYKQSILENKEQK